MSCCPTPSFDDVDVVAEAIGAAVRRTARVYQMGDEDLLGPAELVEVDRPTIAFEDHGALVLEVMNHLEGVGYELRRTGGRR